jgi:hypothetical protein
MGRSRKKRLGVATLVLALVAVLAAVPAVDARKKKDKPVNIVKQANVPIPAATSGPPFTSGKAQSQISVTKKKKWSIRDVNIDLHIVVPPGSNTDDLRVLVSGPQGAVVNLVSFVGSVDATGFGTSCDGGATLFDDQAHKFNYSSDAFDPAVDDPNSLEYTTFPPYAEKVQPFGFLNAVFKGEKVKGTWTISVYNFSTTETGTLVCWSLHAKPQKPQGTRA